MKCDELKAKRHIDEDTGIVFSFYEESEVDAAIAELKCEINRKDGVSKRWFYRCMEARTENVKLKRTLYKALANWAHVAVAFFSSYTIKEKWRKMENKCLAKKEKYK